jgi:hypothetical protein
MLFVDKDSESQLEEVFRALVGEWGQDNVTISLPAHWSAWFEGLSSIGRVRILFITYGMVSISVPTANIRFDAQINPLTEKNVEDEWLQNYLFVFALRYLRNRGGCLEKSLIEQALTREIEQILKAVNAHVSHTEAEGIAHVIVVKLAARGLATGYDHERTLTDKGRSWLESRTKTNDVGT